MKKIVSLLLVCILMVGVLSSCGGIFVANKINKAAEAGQPISYEDALDKLGNNVLDLTDVDENGKRNGYLVRINGVKDQEDYVQFINTINSGKSKNGIIVTIADGKATAAESGKLNKSSFNK